jgi:hypothetical protein
MIRIVKIFCSCSREGTARAPLFAMASSVSRFVFMVALAAGVGATAGACSDSDPRYGTPEAIRGRKIPFPAATDTDTANTGGTDAGGETGAAKTPAELFGVLYNGATAEDALKTTCAPCHTPGNIGIVFFLGTDQASAYKSFQDNNYKDLAAPKPKGFFTKGAHTGPALTPAQEAATKKWSAAEIAGAGAADGG